MAIGLSALFTTLRKSIGGITFYTNPDGQIIARARTNPVNPNTANQTLIRTSFSDAAALWNTLTDAQRVLWRDYADGTFEKKTGRQVFMANLSMANYVAAREPAVIVVGTDAPVDPGVLPIGSIKTSAPGGPIAVGVAVTIVNPSSFDIVGAVEVSRAFNTSRARFKGPFKSEDTQFVTLIAGASTLVEFLDLSEGLRYFFRIRAVTPVEPMIISNAYFTNGLAISVP